MGIQALLTITCNCRTLNELESIGALECGNLAISELGRKCSRLAEEMPLRLFQLQLVESRNAEDLQP